MNGYALTSCPCCGRIKGMAAKVCKPCEKGYNYGRITMREECAEEVDGGVVADCDCIVCRKVKLIAAAIRQIKE